MMAIDYQAASAMTAPAPAPPTTRDDTARVAGQLVILVGPEDPLRAQAIAAGLAPRIEYRMIADQWAESQVEQWRPPAAGVPGGRLTGLRRTLPGNLVLARQLARGLEPDSVVFSTGETWGIPLALVAAWRRHRSWAHVVYAHRLYSPRWQRFLAAIRRHLAVDAWICATEHQAGLLRDVLGRTEHVHVVSPGVDTAFFAPAEASTAPERRYLLSVGAEMRNYPLLFEAVRDLPIDVIVKASSAWMAASREALHAAPPNVQVITERLSYTELHALYAGAFAVVAPVQDTPQAAGITTILEGMAMQKCVIATRSRGLPDTLIHGETGIVCDATPEALAAALSSALASPDVEALALAGRRAVCRAASIEEHARQVSSVLAKVLASRVQ